MMPDVAAQQPAITIPQSAYSPMSFQAQFLDFGVLPNEPRTAVNFNQLEASMMMPQPMDSRAPWDAFTLAQGFSTNDEYGDTSLYGEEGQCYSITETLEHRANPLSRI
jgi:hypothetical protein